MGFLDKAKAAASDLAAKADTALASAGASGPRPGAADGYFRDLGVLAYLEATGRPGDVGERERVIGVLRDLDTAGSIRSFALHTAPPPAPGAYGHAPRPPGSAGSVPPPPAPGYQPPPPADQPAQHDAPPQPAAPPPPSWASGGA